jgi:hypothetical protein
VFHATRGRRLTQRLMLQMTMPLLAFSDAPDWDQRGTTRQQGSLVSNLA